MDSFPWSHPWPWMLAKVKNPVTRASSLYLGFTSSHLPSLPENQHQVIYKNRDSLAFSENMSGKGKARTL